MTIAPQHGVYVTVDDARLLLAVVERACEVAAPSAVAADVARRMRKAVESVTKLAAAQENPQGGVRSGVAPGHHSAYDLLSAGETANVLGCSASNVRDLRRRGVLPAHRAGTAWLYPARAVYARAERKAARRAG